MTGRIRTMKSVSSFLGVVIIIIISVLITVRMEDLACEGLQVKTSSETTTSATRRRDWLFQSVTAIFTANGICNVYRGWNGPNTAVSPVAGQAVSSLTSIQQPWIGTNLPLLSLEQAVTQSYSTNISWTMGRWPDPILRRPAEPVDGKWFTSETLQQVANLLKRTADQNGAVGLAAQQCGVNARMVYLSPKTISATTQIPDTSKVGIILVNPYIIARSPETDMRVWVEECLVLPSSFRATVLRDDWIDVQYHSVQGQQYTARFRGEASRCLQHEMDHDRGILITDHLPLDELPHTIIETKEPLNMREIEAKGHQQRMAQAYNRFLDVPPDRTERE